MDYIKTNWQNGDIITAEKLNNIEDGITNISGTGGAKIIDLSDIEKQKVSNGMFYPYAGGLTDMDLICSYILSHSEFGTAGNKLVMTATPTHADTADGVMDTVKITLNCL